MTERLSPASAAPAVLVVGSAIVDAVYQLAALPTSAQSVNVLDSRNCLGGCAVNTSNIIRQMGVAVRLLAPVGRGVFADFIAHELSVRGFKPFKVDTDKDCATCICLVEPSGERTMITVPGIEQYFEPAWFDDVDPLRFDAVSVCGYEIEPECGEHIVAFLERYKRENPAGTVYFAPGPGICELDAGKMARIAALSPVWHLNDKEAREFTGCDDLDAAAARIMERGASAVVVTRGKLGASVLTSDGESWLVPTTPVKPVDTVGAGDSNLGAIIACRTLGFSWPGALARANKVSGAVCQVAGAVMDDADFIRFGLGL
ncbi:MAG: hypothetical protein IJH83_05695 [Coriobacteriales bacterium]|nr:hypothetical protein [Coriobacteriales bacterium]